MSLNKIIFYKRISFQSRYFNVEGKKITKLEMALFSKRSTHSIDALPKSLRIGVLSSFGGKAPLVLANTSSTGNYDCRFLQRMRTRDVCLEPRVRYSIGS